MSIDDYHGRLQVQYSSQKRRPNPVEGPGAYFDNVCVEATYVIICLGSIVALTLFPMQLINMFPVVDADRQ